MADYVFHAAEGQYPINDATPPLLQTDFRRPFPASLWRIDENNGGYPYTDYHLGVIYAMPTTGSFENAASLSRVHIPDTVKAFGESAFAGTQLRHVRIAADCAYSENSFPAGCIVTRYPDSRYEQLYDCDGKAVLDCDGARVYVLKEETING